MKLIKYIGLTLAAFSCMQFATAQQAAKLKAYVQVPGGKPTQMVLERGDDSGNFYYLQKGTDQLMSASASAHFHLRIYDGGLRPLAHIL